VTYPWDDLGVNFNKNVSKPFNCKFFEEQDFVFTTLKNNIIIKRNSTIIQKANAHKKAASCCKKTVLITREILHESTKPRITFCSPYST
jgi:hypothetical protein